MTNAASFITGAASVVTDNLPLVGGVAGTLLFISVGIALLVRFLPKKNKA